MNRELKNLQRQLFPSNYSYMTMYKSVLVKQSTSTTDLLNKFEINISTMYYIEPLNIENAMYI